MKKGANWLLFYLLGAVFVTCGLGNSGCDFAGTAGTAGLGFDARSIVVTGAGLVGVGTGFGNNDITLASPILTATVA